MLKFKSIKGIEKEFRIMKKKKLQSIQRYDFTFIGFTAHGLRRDQSLTSEFGRYTLSYYDSHIIYI